MVHSIRLRPLPHGKPARPHARCPGAAPDCSPTTYFPYVLASEKLIQYAQYVLYVLLCNPDWNVVFPAPIVAVLGVSQRKGVHDATHVNVLESLGVI